MGLKYVGDDLSRLCKSTLPESRANLINTISKAKEKADAAFADDTWKGKAAEKFKGYYNDVYGRIYGLFGKINEALSQKENLYMGDYLKIDSDTYAEFDVDRLSELRSDLKNRKTKAEQIHAAVKGQISNVRGICYIKYTEPGVISRLNKMHGDVNKLITAVEDEEKKFPDGFTEIKGMIDSLRSLIDQAQQVQVSGDGKTIAYNPNSFKQAYTDVASAYNAQLQYEKDHAKELEENMSLVQDAMDRRQKDLEARQRAAFGLQIVVAVAAAAVTIATAGAAGPVMAIAVGAAVGATSAAASSIISQSVGDLYGSGLDQVDWGEVGKEALIGGVTGAVSGAIGGGSAKLVTATSKCAHPVAAKIAIKTGEKIVSGAAGRFIDTTIRTGDVGQAFNDAIDGKSVLGDAAGGFVGSATGELLDGFTDKVGLDDLAEKNKFVDYATEIGKDEISDMAKRGAKTYAKTGDLQQTMDDMLDKEEIVKTAASSAAGKYTEDKIEDKITKDDPRVKAKANDQKFQDQQNKFADKDSQKKYEKMYDEGRKEGRIQETTKKESYVNRYSGRDAAKNKTMEKYTEAAEKTVEKSVSAPGKASVSNTVESAFDHLHDGESEPTEYNAEFGQEFNDLMSNS